MQTIVLASNNAGKVKEFNSLLADLNFSVKPQKDYDVPGVPETGLTFVENAIIKARHASKLTGLPALADDSGIEVDALNGSPGIYSARFAGEGASDTENCDLLLEMMAAVPDDQRSARFQCVLVFMRHPEDPTPLIAQGCWEGTILRALQGDNGFGYDPVFWVAEHHCSAAELAPAVKNSLSHRGKATQLLHSLLAHVKVLR
jgi:XTP/dITP diphosphohydrolase